MSQCPDPSLLVKLARVFTLWRRGTDYLELVRVAQIDGSTLWSIEWNGQVWNHKKKEWSYPGLPSSRTYEWILDHRYEKFLEAWNQAKAQAVACEADWISRWEAFQKKPWAGTPHPGHGPGLQV